MPQWSVQGNRGAEDELHTMKTVLLLQKTKMRIGLKSGVSFSISR